MTEQTTEKTFEAIKGFTPQQFVDEARRLDPSLNGVDGDKLLASATFIVDWLRDPVEPPQIVIEKFGVDMHILAKNCERLLKPFGASWLEFNKHCRLNMNMGKSSEMFMEVSLGNGDYELRSDGFQGNELKWYSPGQVKLHLLKKMVSGSVELLPKLLTGHDPLDPEHPPKEPISLLTNKVFERMTGALNYEQREGLLPVSRDRNMESFIKGLHVGAVFVSEEDNYYRAWIAYLYTVIWEEMQVLYDSFTPEMMMQNKINVVRVNRDGAEVSLDEMFRDPAGKKQMFHWWLSKHLPMVEGAKATIKRKE